MAVSLRNPIEADTNYVASLLAELGYPSKDADVRNRLHRSLNSDTSCFLVAQFASEIIGLVSAELVPYFPNGSTICRITGLVVSPHHRGRGVGEKLLSGAADFAREHHCSGIKKVPVQNIASMRTGSTSGLDSTELRSDSSRRYKQDRDYSKLFLNSERPKCPLRVNRCRAIQGSMADLCPLLHSNSGQTQARSDCPLSANGGHFAVGAQLTIPPSFGWAGSSRPGNTASFSRA